MIRKRQRYDSGQYAILPRAVINNSRLSFDARGLLLYLLEKPADWTVSNEQLYAASPGGERHINTLLSELKASGYVHREKVYDPPTRTFRWDTTVYDYPEDNPLFRADRIPTDRMDTDRMDTECMDTKRGDDLILDLPIKNINTGAGDEPAARPPAPVTVKTTRAGLSELERQGYSPNPPTAANRYPARPPLLPHVPLSLRAMDMTPEAMRSAAGRPPEELTAPGRYHQGERGVPRTRAESTGLWMLAVLGIVTGVQLRTGLDDSAADTLWPLACDLVAEGVSPPQVWVAFGDPAGYWYASADHAWKGRRPTAAEVKVYWGVALGWKATAPAAGGPRRATPEAQAAAESAWNDVLQGVRRFNEYRNDELVASLDAVTRAALSAFGGVKRVRAMDVAREGQTLKRQFIGEYQSAAARLRGEGNASDQPSVREPRPAYAA